MADITTRETSGGGATVKGSPLTNAEVDTNFINLQTDKIELTDISVAAEPDPSGDGSLSYNNTTGVLTYTPPADIGGAVTFAAQAGEALSKGDVVYVSGVSGNTPVVSKADADDASKMPAFGLAEADANNNAAVNVVTFGTLYDMDTSSFTAGDTVYVSTTAGAITDTAPTGESSLLQNIGKVIRSHASAGSIKVGGAGRTNATPNLDDGNVFIGNASNQAEARALTGDDISGGTITSFASTGIDDNATETAITIDVNENVEIEKQYADLLFNGELGQGRITTSSGAAGGFSVENVYGSSGVNFKNGGAVEIYSSNDDGIAGSLTIDTSGNTTVNGFTSNGIDDNATSTAITIDSGQRTFFNCGFNRPITVVSTSANAFVGLQDANSGSTGHVKIGSETNDMVFYANAQERMRIKGANVGIGETNPDKQLVVRGSTQQISRFSTSSGTRGYITFADANTTTENNQGIGVVGNDVKIWAGNAEAVTIESSGNVGIGTASPASIMHVEGDNPTFTFGSGAAIDSSPTIGKIEFYSNDNSTNSAGEVGSIIVKNETGTWNGGQNRAVMAFELLQGLAGTTSPVEAMRIDHNGNVGIGTASPSTALHIDTGATNDAMRLVSTDADVNILMGDNTGSVRLQNSGGDFVAYTGTSAFGGFAETMRIDYSGHAIIPAGITLGTAAGTYNAANTLDDYEEGTWTGIVADAASGGNESASACYGYYTKVGNIVYVHFNVANINTTGLTAGNDVYITGLPFTSNSVTGNAKYTGTAHMSVVTFDQTPIINMDENQTAIRIAEVRSAAGIDFVVVSQLSSGVSDIHGNLVYQTA